MEKEKLKELKELISFVSNYMENNDDFQPYKGLKAKLKEGLKLIEIEEMKLDYV